MTTEPREQYAMKTVVKTMGLVAMLAMQSVAAGCSPTKVEAAQQSEQPAPHQPTKFRGAKISAPVELTLTSSAGSGTVVITLTVRALSDIPGAVARVVLPSEIKLLSGQREQDLGALKRGAERKLEITVDAAAPGQFEIFAGVDCHITSGIQQHKEARSIVLGQPPSTSSQRGAGSNPL